MKAWRHVQWDENGITFGRPSAYLLSVLVIKAYQISIDKTPERYIRMWLLQILYI